MMYNVELSERPKIHIIEVEAKTEAEAISKAKEKIDFAVWEVLSCEEETENEFGDFEDFGGDE